MFRTALFGLTATVGLTLPLATADAQAHQPIPYPPAPYPVYPRPVYPVHRPPIGVCWTVLVRTCNYEPWRSYSTYHNESRARHIAHELRHRGYEVRIVVG